MDRLVHLVTSNWWAFMNDMFCTFSRKQHPGHWETVANFFRVCACDIHRKGQSGP